MMEKVHFLENGVSPQREHRFVPLANQDKGQDGAKMGPRWAKMRPRWAKNGLCWTSCVDIGQKLGRYRAEVAGRMENGRGALVRAVKMGPKWVQNGSKSSQDEREGFISRP